MNQPRFLPRIVATLFLAAATLLTFTGASRAHSPIVVSAAVGVPVADGMSWGGFVRYWKGFANRADHVVLVVLLVAATALFIITRGKWLK
jgi:hypothetical protein